MAFASRGTRRQHGPDQADSSRRRVLDLLDAAGGPLTITEITSGTGLHANTVRSHLALLADMDGRSCSTSRPCMVSRLILTACWPRSSQRGLWARSPVRHRV